MTSHPFKDLIHAAVETTHHLANEIIHVAQDITKSHADRAESFLKEKGINVSRESRHGHECHNVVVNSDGSYFSNNSVDFARSLLNQVLFSEDGEERVGNAMGDSEVNLIKIANPKQEVKLAKVAPLTASNTY